MIMCRSDGMIPVFWRKDAKAEADRITLGGMTVLGVPKLKRIVMYQAVKLLGRGRGDMREKMAIKGSPVRGMTGVILIMI